MLALRESDIGAGSCSWLFGYMENFHSLASVDSRHPRRSTYLVGLRTVTAALFLDNISDFFVEGTNAH